MAKTTVTGGGGSGGGGGGGGMLMNLTSVLSGKRRELIAFDYRGDCVGFCMRLRVREATPGSLPCKQSQGCVKLLRKIHYCIMKCIGAIAPFVDDV